MNAIAPITLPVYDAKNRLSALLAEVQKGGEFVITSRGVPVARLVPYDRPRPRLDGTELLARMRQMRNGTSLGGIALRDMIDEGRKY